MKGLRVYIAGALSSKGDTERSPSRIVTDYIQNIHAMCQVAAQVRRLGHYPFVPGLDFLLGVTVGDWEEEEYRAVAIAFLEVCDVILVTSTSWGVSQEVQRARELLIPRIYNVEALGEGTRMSKSPQQLQLL